MGDIRANRVGKRSVQAASFPGYLAQVMPSSKSGRS